jgi:hypothetical protein
MISYQELENATIEIAKQNGTLNCDAPTDEQTAEAAPEPKPVVQLSPAE